MGRITSDNLKPVAERKEASGSEKAKKRKKDDEEAKNLSAALLKHFKPQPSTSSHSASTSTLEDEGGVDDQKSLNCTVNDTEKELLTPIADIGDEAKVSEVQLSDVNELLFDNSDPSTWPFPISQNIRLQLLLSKPNQKQLSSYTKIGPFSFNNLQYFKITNTNEKILREWLLYSESSNSLFCFPCCLFGPMTTGVTSSPWLNYGIDKIGYCDYGHQSRGISRHEETQLHFQSVIQWKQFLKRENCGQTINKLALEEQKKEVSFWKAVLTSMLDAVIFLAKNNLAFRGSSNVIGSENCGNFLSLIELLSHYHPPLALHINRLQKKKATYMSNKIQNEFISLAAKSVRDKIITNIKGRKFFSILFDATPDSSHKEQVSQIIRTVKISETGCQVEENFVSFIHCDEKTGEQLTETILEKLRKDGLDIADCRGQGYDNGSNMVGVYKGVQARIKEINPLAVFLACACHSLNLVGSNAASKVLQAKLILGQVQNIYNFFSSSPSRWTTLKKHVKKIPKSQSNTRWSSKAEAVLILYDEFEGITEALLDITNSEDTNASTLADANGIFNQMYNFKFLLAISIWDYLLGRINIVNIALQQKNIELGDAAKHLRGLLDWITQFKDTGFLKSYERAKKKAEDVGISEDSGFTYRLTRNRRPVRFRDTAETEEDVLSNHERFKSEFYDAIIDKLLEEFKNRFSTIHETSEDFAFLWGAKLASLTLDEIIKHGKDLSIKYSNDLDIIVFLRELEYLKSAVSPFVTDCQDLSSTTALDILNILTQNGLQEQFNNCHTALRIFLTLPVTVASNERSFSKLKIIKNYMRSSMGQERLSDLGILSIEHDFVKQISFDKVIDEFAEAKCRKVKIST